MSRSFGKLIKGWCLRDFVKGIAFHNTFKMLPGAVTFRGNVA